ncbi:MAG: hypothetical protein JO129_03320 [Candidatus Dependentiae bacterium]|nr:hypothetical protein [Candidatus Dependentiae bacterium]
MKKFLAINALLIIMHHQINANVKVFINNSPKDFFIRIFDNNNAITGVDLAPGAVEDVFLESDFIQKIIIENKKHSSRPLAAMNHHALRHDSHKINDHMIFIINQDASVRMYKGSTSRDMVLQKIDEAYIKKAQLPTIEMAVHTIKNDKPWLSQKINYNIKYKKSFFDSIQSLFS